MDENVLIINFCGQVITTRAGPDMTELIIHPIRTCRPIEYRGRVCTAASNAD
jgi:hypothetical protein